MIGNDVKQIRRFRVKYKKDTHLKIDRQNLHMSVVDERNSQHISTYR